jgi:dephospho-CoA kinase
MSNVLRLGLTGGIGSGKSTVARLLAQRGAMLVDADAISRQLTTPGGLAMSLISDTFGPDFVTPSGALDRGKMRALAYADAAARQQLEAIVHPLVAQESQKQALLAAAQGWRCIMFDIPLLVESTRWRRQLDMVLVVDCLPETQISRVMARDRLTRQDIERIMATQSNRQQRLAAADVVIFNQGLSLDELTGQVAQISPRFGLSSEPQLATPTISA